MFNSIVERGLHKLVTLVDIITHQDKFLELIYIVCNDRIEDGNSFSICIFALDIRNKFNFESLLICFRIY